MTGKVLLSIGLALFFIIPSILLIEGEQKKLAEEDKAIVTLKLNTLETAFTCFVSLLYTALGIGILYTSFYLLETQVFFPIILLAFGVFFLLDLPLFINHFLRTRNQLITIDKEKSEISIKGLGKEITIDLENDRYEVIRYEPRWKGSASGRPPGADFGKTVILKGKERIEISDLLLKNYDLFTFLNEEEGRTLTLRQINFIK